MEQGHEAFLKEVEAAYKRLQHLVDLVDKEESHIESLKSSTHKFGSLRRGECIDTERGEGVVETVYATTKGWLYDIHDKNNPERFIYLREEPCPKI